VDSNLNILEAKVLEAVALIKELRAENGRLSDRCGTLEASATEFEDAKRQLEHELGEARRQVGAAEVYEQKRKEIEDKVGDLIRKLEAMG
jgi:predicted  nucleic acid-binding Zn-ribbon protein